jgi:hypothetical protein
MSSDTNLRLDCEKYRDILLATLEYERKRTPCPIDSPDYAFYCEIELSQKKYIEENYSAVGLKELQRRISLLTDLYMQLGDTQYNRYIKETTGYEVDIFEGLEQRINKIIAGKKLVDKTERRDAITKIALARRTGVDQIKTPTLKNILEDYRKKKSKKDFPFTATYLSECNSPNNEYCLSIYEIGDSTQVQLDTELFSAAVYHAKGLNLGLTCYWENADTIIIETKKEYGSFFKTHQIISLQQIRIKYIEN